MMNLYRFRALSFTTALACIASVACGGAQKEPIIAEPVERPLPPASGTPIGILIDEAGSLDLRADQLEALREIDQSLSANNDQIDGRLRQMERPTSGASDGGPAGKGPRGGGMGGGAGGPRGAMGGGGMGGPPGGGMGGPPGGGMGGPRAGGRGGRGKGPPPGMRRNGGDPKMRGRLMEERNANTREAIQRALDVLDPDQRRHALRMLDERGVEVAPAPQR